MRGLVIFGLSFLLIIQGCSASKLTLTAQNNDFPISFSEGLYGHNNELILREGYEVVHHFKMEKSRFTWNFFQGKDTKRVDLSSDFDELLNKHKGDAIVNLKITAEDSAGVWFIFFLTGVVTLGLFAPNYVEATIEGDVIRLTRYI